MPPPVMVKLSSIKIVDAVYPRTALDGGNLARLRRAAEAGFTLPPIVVEKKTHTLIDGRHRLEIARKAELDKIPAFLEPLPTHASMFRRAVELNAQQGAPLAPLDVAHCIIRAGALGISDADLAVVLAVPLGHIAVVRGRKTAIDDKGDEIPIKSPLIRFARTQLTKKQTAGNVHAVGLPQVAMVNQVINLFENHLVDLTDAALIVRLRVLKRYLRPIK